MRCAQQAIHGTANRQLSNQESQFELAVLLINLDLEMLHVLDKLEILALKGYVLWKTCRSRWFCNV